jgi:hypothetical protein
MLSRDELSTFVGIDLGGGKGKNTAVALLERCDDGVCVRFVGRRFPEPTNEHTPARTARNAPFYDDELLGYLRGLPKSTLLAIDAPLTRTACTRCVLPSCPGLGDCPDPATRWMLDKGGRLISQKISTSAKPLVTPYTQRACEVLMHRRYGIMPRETLGQGMGPLTARAHYLVRALETRFPLDKTLIEVYPKATLHELCGADVAASYKRTASTWRVRAQILESLGERLHFDVWREGCLQDDHCFDAVICAFTGYLWAEEGWELPLEDRSVFESDGWIWFPRPDESHR